MMQAFQGNAGEWNALIAGLPDPHLLQTWEWSQVKVKYGWEPIYVVWSTRSKRFYTLDQLDKLDLSDVVAAAVVLKRRIPVRGFAARLNILYIPKGPLLDWSDEPLRARVLDDLQSFAKKQGAIFLKIDPDVVLGTGVPVRSPTSYHPHRGPDVGMAELQNTTGHAVMSDLKRRGWLFSADQIQFRNTVLIDLSPSEDELLARMKQKTRYNIRLAARKGVTVRVGDQDDLPMLYKMYAETSVRDGFVIRDEGYYQTVWQTFMKSSIVNRKWPMNRQSSSLWSEPLIAEVDGEPVAAIFVFAFARRAYYLYGMSREAHREKMPNYLLQWEALRRAKTAGCRVYDLWGAPDVFDESDAMWGVFRFKEGLGGQVARTLGAWDYTPKPFWYKMYSEIIPRALDVMRSRGRSRTRQAVE
jgi:lipid II:glycine glycyltransferase (peptidoglycan interpeptide bridge formation enzyme)